MQQSASRLGMRLGRSPLFPTPVERTSSISRFRGKGQKTNLIWFRLHEDAAPATSFVLNEGRLWSHLRTTRHYTNTGAARIALAHTRRSSYPCMSTLRNSITSQSRPAERVLSRIHACGKSFRRKRRFLAPCLMKILPHSSNPPVGWESRNVCEFDLLFLHALHVDSPS